MAEPIKNSVDAQTETYGQIACLLAARSIQKMMTRTAKTTPTTQDTESIHSLVRSDNYVPPSVEVTEYFLLRQHPGYIPAKLLMNVCGGEETHLAMDPIPPASCRSSATDGKGKPNEVYLPVCGDCGGALQPGLLGTSIRLQATRRLSRTARRRASRRRAVSLKHQRDNGDNKQRSNMWQYCQQQKQQGSTQFLDCCKNLAIVTCGSCGGTSKLPGIANPKPEKKGSSSYRTMSRSHDKKVTKGVEWTMKGMKTTRGVADRDSSRRAVTEPFAATTTASGVEVGLDEEFISLAAPAAPLLKRKKVPPKLGEAKKKKKKPGELMSFLSSLND